MSKYKGCGFECGWYLVVWFHLGHFIISIKVIKVETRSAQLIEDVP